VCSFADFDADMVREGVERLAANGWVLTKPSKNDLCT
jgi:hypothetical protein